jgi:bacteriocin-like protein
LACFGRRLNSILRRNQKKTKTNVISTVLSLMNQSEKDITSATPSQYDAAVKAALPGDSSAQTPSETEQELTEAELAAVTGGGATYLKFSPDDGVKGES